MITRVKGSSSPLASEVTLVNGDSVQDFFDNSSSGSSGTPSYIYGDAVPLWSGSAKNVDVSSEPGFVPGKPCFVTSELNLSTGGTLGTTIDLVFPSQLQLITLLAGAGDQVEFGFVTSTGSSFSIVGSVSETRAPATADFVITDIRQVQ